MIVVVSGERAMVLDAKGWDEMRFWLSRHERSKPHVNSLGKQFPGLVIYTDIGARLILLYLKRIDSSEEDEV